MKDTDLTKMSDLELAQYKEGSREDRPRAVLVEREFKRRDREEQAKLMRYSVKIGALFGILAALLGAIVGAIITAMLPIWLKGCSPQTLKPKTEPSTISSSSAHQKTTNEVSLDKTVSPKSPMKK